MKGAVAIRGPVGAPAFLDTSSTNIGTGAYVQLQTAAAMTSACSAIMVSNGGTSPLKMALGASGNEVDNGVIIPPSANTLIQIPVNIAAQTRITLKSLSGTQSSGVVTMSFFQ